MSKTKQYGITKPKSLDFLLAITFGMVAVSALWIGIWMTVTKTQSVANQVFDLSLKALIGDFSGEFSWVVMLQSFLFYAGALASVVLCVLALARKQVKAIAGFFALLFSTVAICLQIAFFALYFNTDIFGLFLVFLLIFMLIDALVAYYTFKLMYSVAIKQSKGFNAYRSEFGKVIVPIEVVKEVEEEKKEEEKQPSGPTESLFDITGKGDVFEENYELVYDNSNSYRDYMYHENVVRYMNGDKQEEFVAPQKEEKVELKKEEKPAEESAFGNGKGHNYTFEQKLKKAKPVARQYFKELKQYFEELGFKSELTKSAETFSYKNVKYAAIGMAGQSGLKVYYKLDVKDYENSSIPVKDVGNVKKYEKTPLLFVTKSDLAVKRAKKLMNDVKKKHLAGVKMEELPKKEEKKTPAKPKEPKKQVVKKEVKPQPKVEPKVEAKKDNQFGIGKGNNFTFEQKLRKAKPVVRQYFKELTTYFVSLGFRPELTKSAETFSYKNVKYASISVAGQSGLKVYYKLDVKDYENSPIPVKNVGNVKKYEKTPLLFVAKSELAVKRAKKLMNDLKSKIK